MVTNIKNFIPITLGLESSHYSSWAELFKIHFRAFQVIDHLESSTPKVANPKESG
jgi:hypothetical protein